MRTLDKYLLRRFYPMLIISLAAFMFILLLIDLFTNLVRYLNNEVPLVMILRISMYYIPKSFSYALPISLLFAAAYTLGELYSGNELISIFSSGIPFWRFSASLVAVGFIASFFIFAFDDILVIPTFKTKNELTRRALNLHVTENNSDVSIISEGGRIVYKIDFFDHGKGIVNGVNILESDESGGFVSQIRAVSGSWNGFYWEFDDAVIYQFEDDILRVRPLEEHNTSFNENPDMFRRSAVNVQDLPAREAGLLVKDLRAAGQPYMKVQANYFQRFSFSATPFIVMLLSISMSGRFRKNILLMSLATSLGTAVVFYVVEMLSMTMAGLNYIFPLAGAWFPVILFLGIGLILLRGAKT